jgi:hypothetical protein
MFMHLNISMNLTLDQQGFVEPTWKTKIEPCRAGTTVQIVKVDLILGIPFYGVRDNVLNFN